MKVLFITLLIVGIAFSILKFTKKKKEEEVPTTRRSYTSGDSLPTDKIDNTKDEELKPE
jgi:hypothetical protein